MNEFLIWLTTAMRQRWSGEVVLHDADGRDVTRFYRPGLKRPPATVMRQGSAYGDTGRNDYHGFRIYVHNRGVYHYIGGTE